MRFVHLIPRTDQRRRGLRIEISQAEITADLVYPASPRSVRERGQAQTRRVGR